MRLKDKVAIITGAGTGIGRSTAIVFAKEGAKVVVSGINEKECQEVVDKIKKAKGEAVFVKADVSVEADIINMVKACTDKYGTVDILVNNAGVVSSSPLHEITEDEWKRVLGVDLKGVFFGIKHVIPHFLGKKKGKIVNIASIAGLIGFDGSAAYCAAKGAVVNLTREAAVEYAPKGINVNAIAPGIIKTPMTQSYLADKNYETFFKMSTPYPRFGEPEDIAMGALYLASDESDFVNGAILVIDGGWVAK